MRDYDNYDDYDYNDYNDYNDSLPSKSPRGQVTTPISLVI